MSEGETIEPLGESVDDGTGVDVAKMKFRAGRRTTVRKLGRFVPLGGKKHFVISELDETGELGGGPGRHRRH